MIYKCDFQFLFYHRSAFLAYSLLRIPLVRSRWFTKIFLSTVWLSGILLIKLRNELFRNHSKMPVYLRWWFILIYFILVRTFSFIFLFLFLCWFFLFYVLFMFYRLQTFIHTTTLHLDKKCRTPSLLHVP